jgi:hypothetical protein
MKKILFINHKVTNCGVYQYGKRTADILVKSKKMDFQYVEVESQQELLSHVADKKPDICLFNYHQVTMGWLKPQELSQKKVAIFHEGWAGEIKNIITVDPLAQETNTFFKVVRPILNTTQIEQIRTTNKITIGSFGFGFEHKGFDEICRLVNNQFDEAEIRLHITFSHYWNNKHFLQYIVEKCKQQITKLGIELKINDTFLSDEQLLAFLGTNDINIFAYERLNGRGPASVLDYVVGLGKPVGLSRSYMFKHVEPYFDYFDLEKYSIKELLQKSPFGVNKLKELWSNENLIRDYETIMEKIN